MVRISQDRPVGMGWEDGGSNRERITAFSSPQHPDRLWGSSSLLSDGYLGFFLRVKRPRHEADHLPPSSVEAKNGEVTSPFRGCIHDVVLNTIQLYAIKQNTNRQAVSRI
jgi:hypothetical protein